MALDKELVDHARKTINNLFGRDLERKASDDFCVAFGLQPDAGGEAFAEAVPLPARAAVIEFAKSPDILGELRSGVENLMHRKEWGLFEEALGDSPFFGDFLKLSAQTMRQSMTQQLRDDFQKACGYIKSHIEGSAAGFQPGSESLASPTTPSAVTERCWLNRTMRTWVAPHLLSEIMADNSVARLDVPRRLQEEMLTTMQTVKAPQYRQRKNVTGKGVIVAVIDFEVALDHPALDGRVVQKKNYSLESWGKPGRHGTAVAGIVAAKDPAGAFAGVAPDATIYNYKVLATETPTSHADDFGGSLALQQALEDGADIANCSWGAGVVSDGTSREAEACNTAWALGMSIVKSSGNRGIPPFNDWKLTTPADADGVIVVGATEQNGLTVQNYSSRGLSPNGEVRPHVVAPGGSTMMGLSCILNDGKFGPAAFTGTSFAAPHVAGMLALFLEERPDMTPDEQRTALIAACRKLDPATQAAWGSGFPVLDNIP